MHIFYGPDIKEEDIIIEYKKMLDEVFVGYASSIEFFNDIKKVTELSSLEMMIIDSSIKRMPLERLHKTLLIPTDTYFDMLQILTNKFIVLYLNK